MACSTDTTLARCRGASPLARSSPCPKAAGGLSWESFPARAQGQAPCRGSGDGRSPRRPAAARTGRNSPVPVSPDQASTTPTAPAPDRSWPGLHKARPNALQLRDCDFDGGGAWVEDFSVFGSFDGPVAGAVAFDDAGVGAVSALAVGVGEDFGFHSLYCVRDLVRGKSRWSLRLRGGLPVGSG